MSCQITNKTTKFSREKIKKNKAVCLFVLFIQFLNINLTITQKSKNDKYL